jgi:hypothetical protein
MVEQGRDNNEDGNNSDESYAPADDDSLFSVQEDDGSNNVGLDDILGTDLISYDDDALGVDGTSDDDDAQSREAPADQLGADVEDAPTATCADEEEYPPTAEENVKFTDLDVASLCLFCNCATILAPIADCMTISLHFSVGLSRKRLTSQKQRAEHRS